MDIRKLRVESLEERALLAVIAGGFEQAAELVAPTTSDGPVEACIAITTTVPTAPLIDDVATLYHVDEGETIYVSVYVKSTDARYGIMGGRCSLYYDPSSFTVGDYVASSNFPGETINEGYDFSKDNYISPFGGVPAGLTDAYGQTQWALVGTQTFTADAAGVYDFMTGMARNKKGVEKETWGFFREDYSETGEIGNPVATFSLMVGEEKPSIEPSIEDVSLTGWEGFYDGTGHTISVNDPCADTDTILYSTDGWNYNLTAAPEYTNPGSYTNYVKVSREGYRNWFGSAAVNIYTKLIVTTLEDIIDSGDGVLSLREAISLAQEGETITFDESLARGTIILNGSQLEINKGITIDASDIGGITVNADGKSCVLYITGGNITNPVKLVSLLITGGYRDEHGGGIYNNSGTVIITNSGVSGNTANKSGGGFYNNSGAVTLINSVISQNTASNSGGGFFNYEGTVTFTTSTVVENTANRYIGGGICNSGGTVTITNSVISGNTASNYGGGIYNGYNSSLTLTNSTVSGNTANTGGGIHNSDGNILNASMTLMNTIVSLNYACYDSNISHRDPFGGSNNIIGLDPGFAVAPIFEDGILINADDLDFSLTAGSIAIDTGTNGDVEIETDIAGNPRIVSAWRDTATVDIGAYEYQSAASRDEIETPSTVVTTSLDIVDETDGLISLREAILYAMPGEMVTFDPSLTSQTIILDGAELTIDKILTIDAFAIGGITINAAGQSRVLYVSGGYKTSPVKLNGLTITGGQGNEGAGIHIYHGTLTMTNCTVSENITFAPDGSSRYGGGIYNDYGTLIITNSVISRNTAKDSGGGIYNNHATLTMTNCTVSENSTISSYIDFGGGGIVCSTFSTLTMTNCKITGNYTGATGGGIRSEGISKLTLINSVVSGNTAKNSGGGIYNKNSTLTMTDCTVSGNNTFFSSSVSGGGIYNTDQSILTLTGSTVSGNTAYSGGGIDNGGTLTLYNTIIAQNTAVIPRNDIYSDSNNTTINAYNTLSSYTDWTESENCVVYDPSIPLFTDALHGDFTPAENSQAVNAGNNDYVKTETDLAGNPRIYGDTVDIGAYEYQGTLSPVPTEQLAIPTIITGNRGIYVSYGVNRHQITWTAVENASGYELAYTTDGFSWSSAWVDGTSGAVGDLTYGSDVTYRVRALGEGPYIYSDWSETKTFRVCPMDINNDGDISGPDRTLLSSAWLTSIWDGDEGYRFCADIDGNGDISNSDRVYLSKNWLADIDAYYLDYPTPITATIADTVFTEYASADMAVDLNIF